MKQIDHNDMVAALRSIHDSINERSYSPSQREIAAARGRASSGSGHTMVRKLVDAGLVEVDPGRPRTIRITKTGMKALTETL